MIQPASLLLCLLALLVFFILGLYYAGITGAGEGQGLAGGAIVLGYGVLFGLSAVVAALFLARYAPHRYVVRANWILALVFVALAAISSFRGRQKAPASAEKPEKTAPSIPTSPADYKGSPAKPGFFLKFIIRKERN